MRPALLIVLLFSFPANASDSDAFMHELHPLRDDIYVAMRPDVNRVPVTGNITFIINEHDVIVVDAGGTPASARNAIALLRQKTDLPVSAIINTHWHGDHHLGNSAWKEQWPEARIIAHVNTLAAMTGEPMAYLEDDQEDNLRQQQEAIRERLDKGKDGEGRELEGAEREHLQNISDVLPALIEQSRQTRMVLPDRTFEDALRLERPGRRIDVRYLGRGNTDGDAVVHLPDDGIVITGDLVVMPVPFGFYSYPGDWIETLNSIKALEWDMLVPGHGEVQSDAQYLDTLVTLLTAVREQVTVGVESGKTLEAIRETLDLGATAEQIIGDDQMRKRHFEAYWIAPITKSAWKEATGTDIVQGEDAT